MRFGHFVLMRARPLAPLAFISFMALVPSAHAAVVWTATFEKGDSSEWQKGQNPLGPDNVRKNFEVLGEQMYRGKFAGKIVVHPDDHFSADQVRVDIQHQSTLTGEGKESWLSGHYYLPQDVGGREEFGFYESNSTYANVMDFWFDLKPGGGTTINFGTGFLGDKKLWTADFSTGKWHQVAVHVLWSTDPQKGQVDVWFDGQQVVTAAKAKTKADANTLFYQTGLHRRDLYMVKTTDTVYLDEFIEADSFADAKIAAPTPDSAGSGGSGGAGMAGMGGAGASGGSPAGGTSAGSSSGGSGTTGGTGATGDTATGLSGTPGSAGNAGGTAPSAAGSPSAGAGSPSPAAAQNDGGCSLSRGTHGMEHGSASAALALLGAASLLIRARRRSAAT